MRAPELVDEGQAAKRFRVGFHLGQNLYTPEDTSVSFLQEDDRPYGAWLYGGIELTRLTLTAAHSVELDIGVVGPAALGEQTQNSVHRWITNSPEAQGWDNQLTNEAALLLRYAGRWRTLAASTGEGRDKITWLDAIPAVRANAGNVFTGGSVGATLRLGYNLPDDFGAQAALPSISFFDVGGAVRRRLELYGFVAAEERLVVRNIFLDGNTFTSSHSVEKKDFVRELEWGVVIRCWSVRFIYRRVNRSPEFYGRHDDSNFGALQIAWNIPSAR